MVSQKRSHVRSRIIANALADQIRQSDSVIIMGHRQSDLDAIGSAIGLLRMCENVRCAFGHRSAQQGNAGGPAAGCVQQSTGRNTTLLNRKKPISSLTPKTLLIVTDTYQKRLLEDQKIYGKNAAAWLLSTITAWR